MRQSACCFTGHRIVAREDRAPLETALRAEIASLYARGVTAFYTGGARGFDTMAAEAVLEARETLPITLHLLLPCPEQCRGWTHSERMRYASILNRADSVTYMEETYTPDCMRRRNDALVEAAGHCVCYLQRAASGTMYTVSKARAAGLEIIHLLTTAPVFPESEDVPHET